HAGRSRGARPAVPGRGRRRLDHDREGRRSASWSRLAFDPAVRRASATADRDGPRAALAGARTHAGKSGALTGGFAAGDLRAPPQLAGRYGDGVARSGRTTRSSTQRAHHADRTLGSAPVRAGRGGRAPSISPSRPRAPRLRPRGAAPTGGAGGALAELVR